MRQYDSLKKLIVLRAAVLTLIGIFPMGSLTGIEKANAAQEI